MGASAKISIGTKPGRTIPGMTARRWRWANYTSQPRRKAEIRNSKTPV